MPLSDEAARDLLIAAVGTTHAGSAPPRRRAGCRRACRDLDPRRGFLVRAYGNAVRDGASATVADSFRIASITKTFTATIVVQLVDEGRIADAGASSIAPDTDTTDWNTSYFQGAAGMISNLTDIGRVVHHGGPP